MVDWHQPDPPPHLQHLGEVGTPGNRHSNHHHDHHYHKSLNHQGSFSTSCCMLLVSTNCVLRGKKRLHLELLLLMRPQSRVLIRQISHSKPRVLYRLRMSKINHGHPFFYYYYIYFSRIKAYKTFVLQYTLSSYTSVITLIFALHYQRYRENMAQSIQCGKYKHYENGYCAQIQ